MQQVKVLTSNCATQKEMEQFYWPERMQVVRLVVHTAQDTGICVTSAYNIFWWKLYMLVIIDLLTFIPNPNPPRQVTAQPWF